MKWLDVIDSSHRDSFSANRLFRVYFIKIVCERGSEYKLAVLIFIFIYFLFKGKVKLTFRHI